MAILKDTTILGDARVTDTLYANTINGLTLTAEATGFTITGGTTSKTLTVSGTATINEPTQWGIVYGGASGAYTSTAAGTSGQYLTSNGNAAPTWATFSNATVGLDNVENIKLSTWTGSNNIATVGTITSGTWQGTTINASYLPTATDSAKGIVQVGAGLSVSSGTVSINGIDTSSGSTTKCLTEKGTWATFGTSNLALGTTAGAALAASGSAGSATTAAKSDHVHPFPTAANVGAATNDHTHGNITNGGCITEVITPANSDYLIIGDSDASGKLGKGPTFVGTTANQFLRDTGAFTAIMAADLPAATTSAKGAVIVGTGLSVSSGTVSVAYGTSANTALEGDTDINKVKQNAASTANTDYPILLAASADTTLQTDYVNKSAQLIYNPNNAILTTPHLTISNVAAHSHLTFSRTTWNYITGPAESIIAFNFGTIGSNDSTLAVSATSASPGKSNTYDLGESATRWRAIYANNYVPLTRTTTTLNNTAGTYSFALTATISQINSSSDHYVGLQIGDDDSKWQLTNQNNTLWFRQNSNGGTNTAWETWTQVLDTSLLDNTISTTIVASHIPTTQAVVDYIAENVSAGIEIIRL